MEVLGLAQLALVTGFNIPPNVFVEIGPPETNENVLGGREGSFMTEFVVSILDERETVFGIWDELRAIVAILPEELSIVDEVVRSLTNELSISFV